MRVVKSFDNQRKSDSLRKSGCEHENGAKEKLQSVIEFIKQ